MNFLALMSQEFKAVLNDRSIVLTVFVAVIGYAILYPLPYWHEVPTRQKIIVVDHDKTTMSRQLIRYAQSNPKLDVTAQLPSIAEAKVWIESGRGHGLLVIPEHFSRHIMTGKGATVSLSADASYFLIFSAVIEGLVDSVVGLNQAIKTRALLSQGENKMGIQRQLQQININKVPVFNSSLGYTPYVVPGLFLLILHQTLLIGMAILGASQWRQRGYWTSITLAQLMTARFIVFLFIYMILALLYVGFFYAIYQVNCLATMMSLMAIVLVFLMATVAFGLALSTLFIRRDLPTQVVLLSSMPILFVSGFVWPLILIPPPLIWLSYFVPATPAIMAMLKLNQMGVIWQDVLPLFLHLVGLVVGYLFLAYWGFYIRLKRV